jgi:hypothetical protein
MGIKVDHKLGHENPGILINQRLSSMHQAFASFCYNKDSHENTKKYYKYNRKRNMNRNESR